MNNDEHVDRKERRPALTLLFLKRILYIRAHDSLLLIQDTVYVSNYWTIFFREIQIINYGQKHEVSIQTYFPVRTVIVVFFLVPCTALYCFLNFVHLNSTQDHRCHNSLEGSLLLSPVTYVDWGTVICLSYWRFENSDYGICSLWDCHLLFFTSIVIIQMQYEYQTSFVRLEWARNMRCLRGRKHAEVPFEHN